MPHHGIYLVRQIVLGVLNKWNVGKDKRDNVARYIAHVPAFRAEPKR